jgi:hypothetical protein
MRGAPTLSMLHEFLYRRSLIRERVRDDQRLDATGVAAGIEHDVVSNGEEPRPK